MIDDDLLNVCIVLFDTNNFVLSFHPIYHNIGPVL